MGGGKVEPNLATSKRPKSGSSVPRAAQAAGRKTKDMLKKPVEANASIHIKLSSAAVVKWVVQSLYVDEALPRGTLLQWVLESLVGVKLAHKRVRDLVEESGVPTEPPAPKRLNFHAVLEDPPPGFKSFSSELDLEDIGLPPALWEEAKTWLAKGGWPTADDPAHKVYVVAAWLQDVSEPLCELSFGKVLSMVRCSAGSLGLLGHRGGVLVPYADSEECERRLNAVKGKPTAVAPDERFVSTWEELKDGLRKILVTQPSGTMEVSKVKLIFRETLAMELSETVFGYESLSKLLRDPALGDDFILDANCSSGRLIRKGGVEQQGPERRFLSIGLKYHQQTTYDRKDNEWSDSKDWKGWRDWKETDQPQEEPQEAPQDDQLEETVQQPQEDFDEQTRDDTSEQTAAPPQEQEQEMETGLQQPLEQLHETPRAEQPPQRQIRAPPPPPPPPPRPPAQAPETPPKPASATTAPQPKQKETPPPPGKQRTERTDRTPKEGTAKTAGKSQGGQALVRGSAQRAGTAAGRHGGQQMTQQQPAPSKPLAAAQMNKMSNWPAHPPPPQHPPHFPPQQLAPAVAEAPHAAAAQPLKPQPQKVSLVMALAQDEQEQQLFHLQPQQQPSPLQYAGNYMYGYDQGMQEASYLQPSGLDLHEEMHGNMHGNMLGNMHDTMHGDMHGQMYSEMYGMMPDMMGGMDAASVYFSDI